MPYVPLLLASGTSKMTTLFVFDHCLLNHVAIKIFVQSKIIEELTAPTRIYVGRIHERKQHYVILS